MDAPDFFHREALVAADLLRLLADPDFDGTTSAGFDDLLYLQCQRFLKAHDEGISARHAIRQRLVEAEEQRRQNGPDADDRSSASGSIAPSSSRSTKQSPSDLPPSTATSKKGTDVVAIRRRWVRKVSRLLEDPRSSTQALAMFVFIAVLVLFSIVMTIASTLPAYNPRVRPDLTRSWNNADLIVGILFTIELAARVLVATFDDSFPTSRLQNFIRYFAKAPAWIDVISIAPTYAQMFVSPSSRVITGTLRTVRLLRLFKILRVYKPVRIMQKALKFAGRGLIAPLLFTVTMIALLSASVYFAEHGTYDDPSDKFLIDESQVCVYEPSYFLSLGTRMPSLVSNQSTAAPSSVFQTTTMVPTSLTLPPGAPVPSLSASSSSANYGGSSSSNGDSSNVGTDPNSFPFVEVYGNPGAIASLQCPLTQATFISIPQSTWWTIATMSTCGFGDFITVTWVGHILAVVAILSGLILNAMPIAVIDASLVTTLKSEDDQQRREAARRRQLESSIKGLTATGLEESTHFSCVTSESDSGQQHAASDPLVSSVTPLSHLEENRLTTPLLEGHFRTPVSAAAAAVAPPAAQVKDASGGAAPSTEAEQLLLQWFLLTGEATVDLANPSDMTVLILDRLLEAAITNTAHNIAVQTNKELRISEGLWQTNDSGFLLANADGGTADAAMMSDEDRKRQYPVPNRVMDIALTHMKVITPIATPSSAPLKSSITSLSTEMTFDDDVLLEAPVRCHLGAAWEKWQRSPLMTAGEGGDDDGDGGAQHISILDHRLLNHLQLHRSEMVRNRSSTSRGAQLAETRVELHNILRHHCDVVIARGWGDRHLVTLLPRRFPPTHLDIAAQQEIECFTVQVLRFVDHRWTPLLPHASLECAATQVPTSSAYRFRSRAAVGNTTTSVPDRHATRWLANLSLKELAHLSSASSSSHASVSTFLKSKDAKTVLEQLRRPAQVGHRSIVIDSIKSSESGSGQHRDHQGHSAERAAKARKEAETREMLEALSSEKRAAFAVLQTFDLDAEGTNTSSDRLSLLTLATTVADKLEQERTCERQVAIQKMSSMMAIKRDERHPRCLLQPFDVILLFGSSSVNQEAATEAFVKALPPLPQLKVALAEICSSSAAGGKFAAARDIGVGSPPLRASEILAGVHAQQYQTLAYVYSE